jgi:polysaccharide biosynthesis transport protein
MSQDNKLIKRPIEDKAFIVEAIEEFNPPISQYYNSPNTSDNEAFNISRYLRIILKYKYSILLLVALFVGVTALGLKNTQALYQSAVTIQIDPERGELFNDSKFVFQTTLDPEYYSTQLQLLTNPSLARQVVKDLDLENNPEFLIAGPTTLREALLTMVRPRQAMAPNKPLSPPPASLPTSTSGDFDDQEAQRLNPFVGTILGGLEVSPIPKTRLVRIGYTHRHSEISQKVANAMAAAFVLNNLKKYKSSSKNTAVFLKQRVAELEAEIRRGEEKLINYGKANRIVSLDDQQNTVAERLIILNRQLAEAESQRKEVESIYKLTQQGMVDTVPEVQNNPQVQQLSARLAELRQKREELLVKYTPEWEETKQVEQAIKQTEVELQNTKKTILGVIENRFRAASDRENVLRGDLNTQMGLTLNQNENAINYKIYQQDVETKKEIYKNLLARLKEVDISSNSEANNIFITDYAQLGGQISPRPFSTLMLALMTSLFIGIGLAIGREFLDNRLRSVEDVDRYMQLPTLGQIPAITPKLLKTAIAANSNQALVPQRGHQRIELVSFTAANSAIAESYRHLRTAIILSSSDKPNKVILMTSGQPGEGKTTTAINTAISFAQTGAKTLLIDCDLRNPRLQKLVKAPPETGLTAYLTGLCALESLAKASVIPNFHVIIGGLVPPNPAELLGSQRMQTLVEAAINQYDIIILDSPPVLSFADALILSAFADGVILVVNSQKSPRSLVQKASRAIQQGNARLLGVVLNSLDLKEHEYTYHTYGYNHYYGQQHKASSLHKIFHNLKKTVRRGEDEHEAVLDLQIDLPPGFEINTPPPITPHNTAAPPDPPPNH